MELGIRGRVAVVGGASRGLGRASAEALAQEGVSLMLCSRDLGPLERAALEIREATGVEVRTHPGDLSRLEVITSLVQATLDHYGRGPASSPAPVSPWTAGPCGRSCDVLSGG